MRSKFTVITRSCYGTVTLCQVKTESCQAGYAVKGLERQELECNFLPFAGSVPSLPLVPRRVGSMPYLALVLDGSFDAGPEKLTRGSWCQSASFDHLQCPGRGTLLVA